MTDDERPAAPRGSEIHVGPRPLGGLADLAELLAGETPGSRRFLAGVLAGAVVGAVLAGGSLRRRWGRRPGDRGR